MTKAHKSPYRKKAALIGRIPYSLSEFFVDSFWSSILNKNLGLI
jgi:hypothetical protein